MPNYAGDQSARLHRIYASGPASGIDPKRELIGQGALWKMVRAALSDPDGELWRYSIETGGHLIESEQIRTMGCSTSKDGHSESRS
ncbi:hypothetical protein [Sphingobium sp. EM0848]|uniref:hypothetical protein n=1 Tax=Sphingobium sp. EM0848 TaxID=2743473 RepID=UPI00159C43A3|nr:hypothetical protein [Sphingobium sp. EM0848]